MPLELRRWSAGDHYRPAGHSRDQKIKELFQKARIPSWRRRFWPIVSTGSRILWARGFGAAAETRRRWRTGLGASNLGRKHLSPGVAIQRL